MNTGKAIDDGFTLVELVMVIVILGLLAAAALPRFADLGSQARQAGFDGVKASFKTATTIAHARAIAQGMDAAGFRDVLLDGTCVNIKPSSGFPTVNQAAGSCTATAQTLPVPWKWIARLARLEPPVWLGLLGVPTASAMPPPPPPPPPPTLPELLIQLDITNWIWTETPPTGTLTSPSGQSMVYNEDDGSLQ